MATSYIDHPSVVQVGNFFAKQYYEVLQNNPNFGHQFYTDASSIIRMDGELKEQASALLQIHMLIVSLSFTEFEIKTVNSLESLSGGILVVVSGSVKSPTFAGWRKFMQTFLLAPQEKGYFVLNDVFHFVSDKVIHQNPTPISDNGADYQHQPPILSENRVDYLHSAPLLQGDIINYQNQHSAPILQDNTDYQHTEPIYMENPIDSQPNNSSPHSESPDVPEDEVDANEHYVFVNKEVDDQVDSYSVQDQQQQEVPVIEVEETPVENSSALLNEVDSENGPPQALVEESSGEPQKFSYASILRAPKVKTAPLLAVYYPKKVSSPAVSEWDQKRQLDSKRANSSAFLPDSTVEPAEEGFSQEGESKSVYVKNLPHTVLTPDIQQEFEKFGKIKPDGVFIKNRKELRVCFAFVEFEDTESVQNAIKASPVQLAGRQVYIEERRPSSISTSNYSRGGGRRGRGRGSYQNESVGGRFGGRSFGRGNDLDGSDNYKPSGNGVRGSY